jgi:hypothetical protein
VSPAYRSAAAQAQSVCRCAWRHHSRPTTPTAQRGDHHKPARSAGAVPVPVCACPLVVRFCSQSPWRNFASTPSVVRLPLFFCRTAFLCQKAINHKIQHGHVTRETSRCLGGLRTDRVTAQTRSALHYTRRASCCQCR